MSSASAFIFRTQCIVLNKCFVVFKNMLIVCVCVHLRACLCTMCMQEPVEARKGTAFLGTGVADGCELPHGC